MSFKNVYSFGPVFRAEKHDTRKHLSEFWMLEVELAYLKNLFELIDFIKEFLTFFFNEIYQGEIPDQFKKFLTFEIIKYEEAIEKLKEKGHAISYGDSLKHEDELELAEKSSVFVTHFPNKLKPFYMKSENNLTMSFDLLWPEMGEICGGGLRENNYDILKSKIAFLNQSDKLEWYLDLRKYGIPEHGGFGIGFERLIQRLLCVENIRDVVLYPRFKGSLIA